MWVTMWQTTCEFCIQTMQWSILTAIFGDGSVCCVLGSSALYSPPLETLTFIGTWFHWKSQLDTGNFEILAVILSCNLIYLTVDSAKLHKLPIGALVAQLGRTSAFEILKFKSSLDLNLFVWLLSILWGFLFACNPLVALHARINQVHIDIWKQCALA